MLVVSGRGRGRCLWRLDRCRPTLRSLCDLHAPSDAPSWPVGHQCEPVRRVRLHDEGPNYTYTFPTYTLGAAAKVKLHTGAGTDNATDLYWGQASHVWNNTGTRKYQFSRLLRLPRDARRPGRFGRPPRMGVGSGSKLVCAHRCETDPLSSKESPMSRAFKVGCQLWPQHTAMEGLRAAWKTADALGFDSVWTWDHFFPLSGNPAGAHFEGWSLLAAMAAETTRARIGLMVAGAGYRNPDLLADMARTVDHVSGGRLYLGVGAGWAERDYREYGYPFGTAGERLAAFEDALVRIKARLAALNPPPLGPLPILVGGAGEKVTLRIVAAHADAWNTFAPLEDFRHKNAVLDSWCRELGRDPGAIERTVLITTPDEVEQAEEFVAAGATHLILDVTGPYDFSLAERLLALSAR